MSLTLRKIGLPDKHIKLVVEVFLYKDITLLFYKLEGSFIIRGGRNLKRLIGGRYTSGRDQIIHIS